MRQNGDQDIVVCSENPGKIPVGKVRGRTLAEATCNAWKWCGKNGIRVANVKQAEGDPPSFDAELIVEVEEPLAEPCLFTPGLPAEPKSLIEYGLEIHGIHNHWVGHGWDYTYNQRFQPQIDLMLEKIESTWLEKGRISSRDFQLTTWDWKTDLKLDDPPCLQIVHCRILPTEKTGVHRLNLTVVFRSRDLGNAFLMNAWAFIKYQRYLAGLITKRLSKYGIKVLVGKYIDFSISNHLYGRDVNKRNLLRTLERLEKEPWQKFAMDSNDYMPPDVVEESLHLIAAQMEVEKRSLKTQSFVHQASVDVIRSYGIDPMSFPYPPEWKEWV